MTDPRVRLAIGKELVYDGERVEIVDIRPSARGSEIVLRNKSGRWVRRVAVSELLASRGSLLPIGEFVVEPGAEDEAEPLGPALADLTEAERNLVLQRAGHVREVLSGYRSGSPELAEPDEPRPGFEPARSLNRRLEAKAAELDVTKRTLQRWIADYRRDGEAGLAQTLNGPSVRVDARWTEVALEVMVEHTDQSRPSRTMVIDRTNARVKARFEGEVACPSRSTAFRVLEGLERRHPTFRLSTKRNRDIAERPGGVYGKLRPTRPGEYLLMDTTRLDVFALDPLTLRWVQAELTVGMDWYSRCITGLRITPVSTKSVDAAATLYQTYRPPPSGRDWPAHAVWPEHGVPRTVLIDRDAAEGPIAGSSGPRTVPETIVIDHGNIYISEHLTSVCQRCGISIQPARLRTGRDKGPVERFFRTVREDVLQALPGYKGPDVHSRGLDPESEAFFYLDELEAIIREWVAVVYHHRPHDSLVDPGVPGLRMSPAAMFEHGITRAGYIEAPADPDLAYQFLKIEWRTVQHYGVEIDKRRYNGEGLDGYRNETSDFRGVAKGRWPIHVDPDDISRVYFYNRMKKKWFVLKWEHAPSLEMPFSEDALKFARKLAANKYTYPDDKIAIADLFERWNLGLGTTRAERRMALRLARQASTITHETTGEQRVTDLSSLTRVIAAQHANDEISSVSQPGTQSGTQRSRRRRRPSDEPMVNQWSAPSSPEPTGSAAEDGDGGWDWTSGGTGESDDSVPEQLRDAADGESGDDDEFDEDDFYADALEDV